MAISISLSSDTPIVEDIELKINRNDPRTTLIKVHERQQIKRIKKLRRGFRGRQHNWLLWWVKSRTPKQDFDDWLSEHFIKKVHLLPSSLYQVAMESFLSNSDQLGKIGKDHIFRWIIDERHRIVAMPDIGLIAFFAPSGNLRKCIDPQFKETAWNWSLSGVPFGQHSTGGNLVDEPQVRPGYLDKLQKKFGKGKGAVIGIIDTGVCPRSDELEGRVIATWAIRTDKMGMPRPDYHPNEDEIGHGTETATIAAGKTLGVAPESRIFSIKLPMWSSGGRYQYSLFHLAAAFNTLRSTESQIVEGQSALSLIDTLLLPNGLYLSEKNRTKNDVKNIVEAISGFSNDDQIVVVAAVGNEPKQTSFPATEANVLSVGAVDVDGKRWAKSGYGLDRTGKAIPIAHFNGCEISCHTLNGKPKRSSGTSMAAAGVAGIVTVLTKNGKTSLSRWHQVRTSIKLENDAVGELPILYWDD
tara:strand:- start:2166 stop:3575 length:1410 start_codon:yes stop_codon:yes gene_type:complete